MTLVLSGRFPTGTVLLSDSRSTTGDDVSEDLLQKLVGINEHLVVGYAGVVAAAAQALLAARHAIEQDQMSGADALEAVRKAAGDEYSSGQQSFSLLVCVFEENEWKTYRLEPPFTSTEHIEDIALIGSGAVIRNAMVEKYETLVDQKKELQVTANQLVADISGELASSQVEGVGGLLQGLLLTPTGIRTLHSGFVDIDPHQQGQSKQITFEGGRWIQHDRANNEVVVILPPDELLSRKVEETIFHDFVPTRPRTKWLVNSFITAMNIDLSHTETKFDNMLTSLAKTLPAEVSMFAYISAFGHSGDFELALVDPSGNETSVLTETIRHTTFPEEFEGVFGITLRFTAEGNYHLLCKFDGEIKSRRLIHVKAVDPSKSPQEIVADLGESHRSTQDQSIASPGELAHFFVGLVESEFSGMSLKLNGQFKAIYSLTYPAIIPVLVNFGIRAETGSHTVKLLLSEVSTGQETLEENVPVTTTSSSIVAPVEASIGLSLPTQGLYYLRLFIDGEFKGCHLIAADSEPPYFYRLDPAGLTRLNQNGQLSLAKRADEFTEL